MLAAIIIVTAVISFCAIKLSDLQGNGRRQRLKVGSGAM